MRILKRALIVVAAVLGLLLVALVVLTRFIDPARFKPQIEAVAFDAIGRRLELTGPIELAWFPTLALRTGAGSLDDAAGFGGAPFASWDSARFGARLLPLLRGRFELDRVTIDGLRLRLARNADGVGNWERLGPPPTQPAGSAPVRPPLRIAGVALTHAQVEYLDARDGTRILVEDMGVEIPAWTQGTPLPVHAHFDLRLSPDLPPQSIDLHTTAAFAAEPIVLTGTELRANLRWGTVPAPGVAVEFSSPRVSIGDGRVQLGYLLRVPDATRQTDLPLKVLSSSGTVTLAGADLAIEPFALTLDDTHLAGSIARRGTPATVDFTLRGDRMNLDAFLDQKKDPAAPPFKFPGKALADFRARGTLTLAGATLQGADLQDVTLRVLMDADGLHPQPAAKTPAVAKPRATRPAATGSGKP